MQAALLLLLIAQPRDFDKVEIKVHKVAGSVYMLEGAGGNIGVSAGADGIVLIDDQFAPLAPKIRAALKGIVDKPVRFVLNTHWHGDHTGGNEAFGGEGTIMAHENVRKRLMAGGKRPDREILPAPKGALPIVTFEHGLTVHLNGEDIRALHYPRGHTDGDSIIIFTKSNVVHMGDAFVTYGFPFIDVSSGGSVKGFVANLEKIIPQLPAGAKIIPGHGPVSTIEDVKKFLATLKEVVGAVEAAAKKGMTADAMKKAKILAKWDPTWGQGFFKADDFIDIASAELRGK
jgi:glyoxylase-like metal-dependent hydrolase (beta-lactamase superfamily II)